MLLILLAKDTHGKRHINWAAPEIDARLFQQVDKPADNFVRSDEKLMRTLKRREVIRFHTSNDSRNTNLQFLLRKIVKFRHLSVLQCYFHGPLLFCERSTRAVQRESRQIMFYPEAREILIL